MVTVAWVDRLLGVGPTLYGVVFVVAAVTAALWVRPADLVCAPVAAPLAFAAGLVSATGLAQAVTELALRAPWLFGGTAAGALVVLVRLTVRVLLRLARRVRRQRRRLSR